MGKVLVLRNCTVVVYDSCMRVAIHPFGKITDHPDGVASTPEAPTSVNLEEDLSAVVYSEVEDSE